MDGKIRLRPYQERVDRAQQRFMSDPDAFRAIVFACTGSGKTVNFFKLIIDETLERASDGEQFRVLIAQPRLALSEEQQIRAHRMLCNYDLTYEFASFHSGAIIEWPSRLEDCRKRRKPLGTTNPDVLEEHRDGCKEDLHITWSSYHSLHQVAHMDYELIICDEAHYLMQKTIRPNVNAFGKDIKTLFYTATPVGAKGYLINETEKTTDMFDDEDPDEEFVDPDDLGMKNEEEFGKVIAEVPPKELIPYGYVVKPLVQLMEVETIGQGDDVDFAQMIGKAYKGQLDMEEVSEGFNHKMLVSMPGVRMFKDVMKNRQTISDEVGKPVDVYCVCADWHGKNGLADSGMSRSDLIADFGETENPAVILHYDTLAEGIDVAGIGGVLFLRRRLGKVKGLQTVGRACRPAEGDILEDGSVKVEGRLKTRAILTLADVDGKTVSEKRMQEWSQFFEVGGYEHLWAYVPVEREGMKKDSDPEDEEKDKTKRAIRNAWFSRLARKRVEWLRKQYNLPLGDLGNARAA